MSLADTNLASGSSPFWAIFTLTDRGRCLWDNYADRDRALAVSACLSKYGIANEMIAVGCAASPT